MDDDLLRLARSAALGNAKAFKQFCARWKLIYSKPKNLTQRVVDEMLDYCAAEGGLDSFCYPHCITWDRVGEVTVAQFGAMPFSSFAAPSKCLMCNVKRCGICGSDDLSRTAGVWFSGSVLLTPESKIEYRDVRCRRCQPTPEEFERMYNEVG